MISVRKSERTYCTTCLDREPYRTYEIRFGETVITVCGVCLMQLKTEIGEVNFSE